MRPGPRTAARRSGCAGRRSPARRPARWRRSRASASSSISPTATIRPSLMPRSPGRAGAPVPSTSVPPRITMSSMASSLSSPMASPDLTGRQITHPAASVTYDAASGAGLRWRGRQSICWPPVARSRPDWDQIAPVPPTSPSPAAGENASPSSHSSSGGLPVEAHLDVDARRVELGVLRVTTVRRGPEDRVEDEQGCVPRRGTDPRTSASGGTGTSCVGGTRPAVAPPSRRASARPQLEAVPEREQRARRRARRSSIGVRPSGRRHRPGSPGAWCSNPWTSPTVQTSASRIGAPCWVIDTASGLDPLGALAASGPSARRR